MQPKFIWFNSMETLAPFSLTPPHLCLTPLPAKKAHRALATNQPTPRLHEQPKIGSVCTEPDRKTEIFLFFLDGQQSRAIFGCSCETRSYSHNNNTSTASVLDAVGLTGSRGAVGPKTRIGLKALTSTGASDREKTLIFLSAISAKEDRLQ